MDKTRGSVGKIKGAEAPSLFQAPGARHAPPNPSSGPAPYPGQIQVSLFAMSPEVYSRARVWPGHRFPVDKEKSQAGQY